MKETDEISNKNIIENIQCAGDSLDKMPVMVWTCDTSANRNFFNRRWLEFTGRPLDAELESGWTESIHKDDSKEALRLIRAAFAQKSDFTVQYRLKRHDGQYRWIVDRGTPLYGGDGNFTGYMGSCIDIHDIKLNELKLEDYTEDLELLIQNRMYELHEKENQLKYFIESLPSIAWIKDKNGFYLLVNSAFSDFTARPKNEIIGKTDFEIYPPEDAKEHTTEDRGVISGRVALIYEKSSKYRNGSTAYLEIIKKPIFNHIDEVIGLAGIARDITERKKAETFLKNANEELEKLVTERTQNLNREKNMIELFYNLVPSGVFTSGNDCIVTSWNKSAEAITGYPAEEIVGKTCPFFCGERHTNSEEITKKLCENQYVIKEGEFKTKDGRIIYILKKTGAIKDENGNITGKIESFEDITERRNAENEIKKARMEAERANRMKSDFLANMSHEIRTPMNSIIGFSDMMYNTKLDENQLDCLSHIKTSGQALLSLINDILDFSKIEAGKLEIENIEFDPARILYEVVGIVMPMLNAKKLDVDIGNTYELKHMLIGDSNRLRQVLLNFATNAIKFSASGKIRIIFEKNSETETEAAVTFGVSDEGIGIAREKLEQIFSPFVQADSSTTRRFGGTGLGLAISNQLVKLMGAEKIFVESRPGRGSKFFFKLNLKKGSLIKGGGAYAPAVKIGGGNVKKSRKILLAEDSPPSIALMLKLLKMLGHEVSVAEDGACAVRAARAEKFDIIFMDVQMPELDGISATLKIREFDRATPIVAMTASAMKDDIDSYLQAGMAACISKPINVSEIEGVINKYAAIS
ncbi:MAG: Autoinducer 2 sensor kinase/phosphatase LuxQ [bacterium ADurb.Bin243]|nr:MAG: Autoinducer 2 sensor kinase/phosphatase LuxQ [bacterium ADurb.Bin243]